MIKLNKVYEIDTADTLVVLRISIVRESVVVNVEVTRDTTTYINKWTMDASNVKKYGIIEESQFAKSLSRTCGDLTLTEILEQLKLNIA